MLRYNARNKYYNDFYIYCDMMRDKIHLIVIIHPWAWLCCRGSRNAKIDSESKHASHCVKMTREVSHCENVNVNEYPGTKRYSSTAQWNEVAAVLYAAGCRSSFLRCCPQPYACDDLCLRPNLDEARSCVDYRHHPRPTRRTGFHGS